MKFKTLPTIAALLTVTASLVITQVSQAQPAAHDGFSYTAGSQLNGTTPNGNGGYGFSSTWSATSAAIATNNATGLSYSTLPVYGGSVVMGNPTITTFATTASSQRGLTSNLGTLAGGGSVWVAFLFQNWNTSTEGKLGFREAKLMFQENATLNVNGTANVSGTERLAVGSPNTYAAGFSDNLGLWNGATFASSGIATPRGNNPANSVFVVLRLDVDATAAADTAYAWFNPSLASEPTTGSANATFNTSNLSLVNALRLQAGNSNASGPNAVWQADELRLAPNWNNLIAPIPEPSSLSFLLLQHRKV